MRAFKAVRNFLENSRCKETGEAGNYFIRSSQPKRKNSKQINSQYCVQNNNVIRTAFFGEEVVQSIWGAQWNEK